MNLLRFIKLPLFVISFVIFSNVACSQQKASIKQARWLIGSWKNQSAKTLDIETWKKLDDSTYAGRSYSLTGKDTLSSEHIRLQQRGAKLYYIPTVKNQNNGKAVTFTLSTLSTKQLVFENPEHDFPQKITYTQVSKDSLVAEISGMWKGRHKAIQFSMKRVK